jgi:subtilisin-like proprotein convertase family protein
VADPDDCDDAEELAYFGATEVCDGVDNNCDGVIDEGVTTTSYADADLDGFGDPDWPAYTCGVPEGYVENSTDCDDSNDLVNPDATETCDGLDNNCDGQIDEDVTTPWYFDFDGDGYGDSGLTIEACSQPPDYVNDSTDCDDNDASVYPGAPEFCDEFSVDSDCDSLPDSQDPDVAGWGPIAVTASPNAPISDYSTTVSQVSVTATPPTGVAQATVLVNLLHTYLGDLTITLIAPDGTGVVLMHWDGQYGDNLVNTLFTDEASVGINGQPGSAAPFTGSFQPEEPLSNLLGVDPNGLWTLEVYDDTGGDVGTLLNWELTLGNDDDFDGDGFLGSCGDCDDEDETVYPGAPEICNGGIDDDCDELTPDSCTDFCAEGEVYSPTGNCFVYVATGAPWTAAEDDCVAMGGYLAVVDDAAENTFARDTSTLTAQAWIGFFDVGAAAGDAFQDVTGGNGTSDWANWLPGEPNGNPGEDCVAYFETPFADPYSWNDAVCSLNYPYICEIEPGP